MQIGICLKMKNKHTTFSIILGKISIFTFDIKNWKCEIYIWNKHEWKCIKMYQNMLNMISKKKYKMKYLIMNNWIFYTIFQMKILNELHFINESNFGTLKYSRIFAKGNNEPYL
jgi:hypothetical protein